MRYAITFSKTQQFIVTVDADSDIAADDVAYALNASDYLLEVDERMCDYYDPDWDVSVEQAGPDFMGDDYLTDEQVRDYIG